MVDEMKVWGSKTAYIHYLRLYLLGFSPYRADLLPTIEYNTLCIHMYLIIN